MTEEHANRRAAWLVIAGLAAIAAWRAWWIIDASYTPDGYAAHHMHGLWSYPTGAVIKSVSLIAAEVVLVSAALLRSRSVPRVALFLGLLAGTLLVLGMPLAMHSPDYYIGHLAWLLFAAGWLFGMALVTAIVRAVYRDRAEEAALRTIRGELPPARVVKPSA